MRHSRKEITREQLLDLYTIKKWPLLKIGRYLGYASRSIQIRANECGIKLRKPGVPGPIILEADLRRLYLKQKLSSRKISKIYNCAYSHIDDKIRQLRMPIRSLAIAHITTKRRSFSGNLAEKAYLIGFRIGDLRVRRVYKNSETIRVDCGSTKPEQIALIKRLFRKYGHVWVSKPYQKNRVQIECSLNLSFSFLLEKNKIFPDWIASEERFKKEALAGFSDAEGSFFVGKNLKYCAYSIGNYNYNILQQIKQWLTLWGFHARLYLGVKKGYTGKDGYSHNSDYWILSISRKSDLFTFTKSFLPYLKHRDKINQARAVISNINYRNKKYGFLDIQRVK